ncbi:acylphosphatase [Halopseudomonas xinjiangensis]|uniref:Acylphosphatase n=1 Tax=Halopseudomonas xinjiangensis TaxID=487184 RepID=A0A1H1ULM7_9GAMM|nr:acylphosphatase [Halopseudomonas xinjiangensis]SDS72719.1 acylphosphatase [Halopseudomonas xinjiangensis]
MTSLCLKGRVRGKVQGVGFRQSTVTRARRLDLAGWVRNCEDGSVEVLIAGDPSAIAAMQQWLRSGPAGARVDELDLAPCEDQPGKGFVRR